MNTHIDRQYELVCHHLVVCIASVEEFSTAGGLCATLRNRLQYAMSKVMLAQKQCSLFDLYKQIPLQAEHELYKELENGFPSPFYLFVEGEQAKEESVYLKPSDILTFSLVLIGRDIANCFAEVVEALQTMCSMGLGQAKSKFELIQTRK